MTRQYYEVLFYHTVWKKWCNYGTREKKSEAEGLYETCLAWHYRKMVKLVEHNEAVLKISEAAKEIEP